MACPWLKGLPLVAVLVAILAVALVVGCTKAPAPTPTPTPKPAPTATPTPPPIASLPIGMGIGQRYHDIHVTRLGLQCTVCHTQATPAYQDPLAQVFNLADRRACLSCHKEGREQPFYGEEWQKAKVK